MGGRRHFVDIAGWPKEAYYRESARRRAAARYVAHPRPPKPKKIPRIVMTEEERQRKILARHMKRHYDIDLEEYERLYEQQEGRCKICKEPKNRLGVDHCHETGKVRGLLCRKCNAGIGMLNDDPNLVRAALEYLCS
jgi:hypothetical protein